MKKILSDIEKKTVILSKLLFYNKSSKEIRKIIINNNMIILNVLKSIKLSTNINNNVKVKIIKRNMFRVINNSVPNMNIIRPNVEKLIRIPSRGYPNKYNAFRWKNPENVSATKHETSHVNIVDTGTGQSLGIFTSSKGPNLPPGVSCIKISEIKYDGSYIPQLNPNTKEPIMDDYGFIVPHKFKGGQYVAVFKYPREVSKKAQQFFEKLPQLQEYLDQHEEKILDIIRKNNIQNKLPIVITLHEN